MKNDRQFLSGSDEELIQALESLLQQKAPDQDAVHAILDELDRRSNASAFDLERGWSDVQARSRASKLEPREASRWKAWLRSAACFLLVLLVTFGAVLALSPEARAAVSNQLGYESVGVPLPAGNITIQLSGEGGGFYTSEHFACVKENGDQLSYAFQNNGTEACYVSLYKVGLLGGYKKVTESILIQPGETGHGSYEDPGNETYCIRVSSQFGGGICGTLDATQTVYLTSGRE